MKIAILEAGTPPERLAGRYPGYGRMTADRLGPGHAVSVFRVNRDDCPADPDAFDATLVTAHRPATGSRLDLRDFVGRRMGSLGQARSKPYLPY
jgi:hypothetical protein